MDRLKDEHELLGSACFTRTRNRYIYVNNRLERSAPWTISAVLEAMAAERVAIAGKSN